MLSLTISGVTGNTCDMLFIPKPPAGMCTKSSVGLRALGISSFLTVEEEVLTGTLEVDVGEHEEMREKEDDEEDDVAWPKLGTLDDGDKNISGL